MKKVIIAFILGVIVTSFIGVVAYSYNARDIEYNPNDTNWNVNNLKDAVDSLEDTIKEKNGYMNYDLSIASAGSYESNVIDGHYYFTYNNNNCSLNSGGEVVYNGANIGEIRGYNTYIMIVKATSNKLVFSCKAGLIHIGTKEISNN